TVPNVRGRAASTCPKERTPRGRPAPKGVLVPTRPSPVARSELRLGPLSPPWKHGRAPPPKSGGAPYKAGLAACCLRPASGLGMLTSGGFAPRWGNGQQVVQRRGLGCRQ